MHIIIFANGKLTRSPLPLPDHALLLAADGGARHAARYGLAPDVVIGDLDSLTPGEAAGAARAGADILRHPADKDETDLELALDHAMQQGATAVTLYGLFGGRWDMTFANLLLLSRPKYAGLKLAIEEGDTRMFILRGGETIRLAAEPGATVSVLPLNGPAMGLTYEGLAWPLEQATLPAGSPRGVSNRMQETEALISLEDGVVLISLAPASKKE